MQADRHDLDGILSRAETERLRECHWFLGYIRTRIETASTRWGSDSERPIKQLIRLAKLVQDEIDKLEPPDKNSLEFGGEFQC